MAILLLQSVEALPDTFITRVFLDGERVGEFAGHYAKEAERATICATEIARRLGAEVRYHETLLPVEMRAYMLEAEAERVRRKEEGNG